MSNIHYIYLWLILYLHNTVDSLDSDSMDVFNFRSTISCVVLSSESTGATMSDRIRLVVMGDSCVGKSAIVKRFLFGEFSSRHVPTIEGKIFSYTHQPVIVTRSLHIINDLTNFLGFLLDLISRDFELGEQVGGNGKPNVLKVDILDTAGDAQFPAMRR